MVGQLFIPITKYTYKSAGFDQRLKSNIPKGRKRKEMSF